MRSALAPGTTTISVTRSPPLDLRTEPELDAALAEIDDGLRHVLVLALVLEYGVAMREFQHVGYALRVEKILGSNPGGHLNYPTSVGGRSVRAIF
jgi:hypothetical protein